MKTVITTAIILIIFSGVIGYTIRDTMELAKVKVAEPATTYQSVTKECPPPKATSCDPEIVTEYISYENQEVINELNLCKEKQTELVDELYENNNYILDRNETIVELLADLGECKATLGAMPGYPMELAK